jgi:cysteine desulfurase
MRVYLDNAATTPIATEVVDAMIPVLREQFGNPSSIHANGRAVRSIIEGARKTVAKSLNVSPGEIFFTSGGTEADNTAIHGAVNDLGVKHIVTSAIEHHAVLHTVQELEKVGKIRASYVNLKANGDVDLENLEALLAANPHTLVSLMHANNEVGNLLPLKEVGELCEKYNAYFHSDTVQTMGHFPFDLQQIKVHFLVCGAHKFHGPKGVGFLFVRSGVKIHPLIHGGSQERNMRGGTENVYGIVGLAKALELANTDQEIHKSHILGLKNYFKAELIKNIPGVDFNGSSGEENSLYTVLSVRFPKSENAEMMLFNLDIQGISCSGGSACTSGSNQGSHVLTALGVDGNRPSVRFSFSRFNTKEDIEFALEKIKAMFPVAEKIN